VTPSRNHFYYENVTILSLYIVVDLLVSVNNEIRRMLPRKIKVGVRLAFLSNYKIFRSASNNTNVVLLYGAVCFVRF